MSIGSLGIIGSVAATPASQSKAGVEKAQEGGAAQERHAHSQASAENAAGIGTTDGTTQTSDRDADGRRTARALPQDTREFPSDVACPSSSPKLFTILNALLKTGTKWDANRDPRAA